MLCSVNQYSGHLLMMIVNLPKVAIHALWAMGCLVPGTWYIVSGSINIFIININRVFPRYSIPSGRINPQIYFEVYWYDVLILQ